MRNVLISLLFTAALCTAVTSNAAASGDETLVPVTSGPARSITYPRIVLYTVSWCPHCKEAMAYLTGRNIPFVNLDVERDDSALDRLVNKYGTQSVPVIVIGNDEAVLKGFDPQTFEDAVRKLKKP